MFSSDNGSVIIKSNEIVDRYLEGKIKEITTSQTQSSCYGIEIELSRENLSEADSASLPDQETSYHLELTLCSELANALPKEAVPRFLHAMTYKHIEKGDRFIRQGDEADHFYLILKGSCIVLTEKDNMLYNIAHLGAGDIVGEMAVFIGERHNSHVDAETALDVLSMGREQFERLSQEYPQLRNYLSEVVTRRLSTSKVTAERKIGKYLITERIGVGGSSIIYKGIHSILNMPVAIKMLNHEMAMEPDFIQILRNEAKIIAQLNHPHIVKVYDIEELYRTIFIIMEYIDGMSLKDILKNTPKLPISKILDITIQVCFGLEYAHDHGITHQDINPNNIFVQSDGQVKIIDFGLACHTGCVDTNFLFPGTLFYISPEQIKGEPADERSDIYFLGMTVYEMITGHMPFPGDDARTVLNWHIQEDIPDTRPVFPDLPDELHNFLMRTIRKEPSARYQDVSEILDELLPLAKNSGLQAEPRYCRQSRMMGMFLVYQDEQQLALKRFIEEFSKNVNETGVVLRITHFNDPE